MRLGYGKIAFCIDFDVKLLSTAKIILSAIAIINMCGVGVECERSVCNGLRLILLHHRRIKNNIDFVVFEVIMRFDTAEISHKQKSDQLPYR